LDIFYSAKVVQTLLEDEGKEEEAGGGEGGRIE
jgi:hypothetical protein